MGSPSKQGSKLLTSHHCQNHHVFNGPGLQWTHSNSFLRDLLFLPSLYLDLLFLKIKSKHVTPLLKTIQCLPIAIRVICIISVVYRLYVSDLCPSLKIISQSSHHSLSLLIKSPFFTNAGDRKLQSTRHVQLFGCFVNKLLLKHIQTIVYSWSMATYCHVTPVDPGSCNRDHVLHKADNIYYLAFYRKSLLSSTLTSKGVPAPGPLHFLFCLCGFLSSVMSHL